MIPTVRFIGAVAIGGALAVAVGCTIAGALGCGGARLEPEHAAPPAAAVVPADAGGYLAQLESKPRPKLIALDWSKVHPQSDAEARAVWAQIAPTGHDWERRLDEIPQDGALTSALAIALLRAGNFTCVPPVVAVACTHPPAEIPDPAPTATLADPCLRRLLALWAIAELDPQDLPAVQASLRAIAAIPPPEGQLVATAIRAIPEADPAGRLELLAIAWRAGQRELVNGLVGELDEPQLIAAATKLHIDGAIEVLSAEGHRAVYLGALIDEHVAAGVRIQAIADLVAADELAAAQHHTPRAPGSTAVALGDDLRRALRTATGSPDCDVAAAAARALDAGGESKFLPARPHTSKVDAMIRALCVLASHDHQAHGDEPSRLSRFVPARGLELVRVALDPDAHAADAGVGEPHTAQTVDLIAPGDAALPELDDLIRAFHHCRGAICRSDDREFRFGFKAGPGGELTLAKLEVVERPPCSDTQAIPPP